jgi:predicted alpha/beta superfamily hydrolase
LKEGIVVVVAVLAAAVSGGIVGGAASVALVRNSYNGPVESLAPLEVHVNSDALGEPMTLRVHLPVEYESHVDRSFPVLWVLDGPTQAPQVSRTMQTLSRIGIAEPSIVVAVPGSSRGRRVDFTPPREEGSPDAQADRFYRFLAFEAIPAVDDAYRTDGTGVLVGHSLGGLFTLYAFVQRPSPFSGFFAFSPSVWVGNEQILDELERQTPVPNSLPSSLFLSLGEAEDNEMLDGFNAVEEILASRPLSGMRWTSMITEGADHGSNPGLSFPVAARWYWDR